MKIPLQDQETGPLAALFPWAPGAALLLHEDVEFERTWVLEVGNRDEGGKIRQGDCFWRPSGDRHFAPWRTGARLFLEA